MFPISLKRVWQNSAPRENPYSWRGHIPRRYDFDAIKNPPVQGIIFPFEVASKGMIFNQDIATTALSITLLEGFAGIFSNSSKGFLNSWSLTTPISYSVRYKEDTLWKVFRICLHFFQEEAKSNAL